MFDATPMKNLAGNTIGIFLFQFITNGDEISFILNESIAEDMYPEIDRKIQPLAHVCCETLLRYKDLSVGNVIMDGNLLEGGGFEVMLSKGLGVYFNMEEKESLFEDAHKIAKLLIDVMRKRTLEMKQGTIIDRSKRITTMNSGEIKAALSELGKKNLQGYSVDWVLQQSSSYPGIRNYASQALPADVLATIGYDHRGGCFEFQHKSLGHLGKIVIIQKDDGEEERTLLQGDFALGKDTKTRATVDERKVIFDEVFSNLSDRVSLLYVKKRESERCMQELDC